MALPRKRHRLTVVSRSREAPASTAIVAHQLHGDVVCAADAQSRHSAAATLDEELAAAARRITDLGRRHLSGDPAETPDTPVRADIKSGHVTLQFVAWVPAPAATAMTRTVEDALDDAILGLHSAGYPIAAAPRRNFHPRNLTQALRDSAVHAAWRRHARHRRAGGQ